MNLTVLQLTTRYRNRNILRDVSVSFHSGLCYLIGANGSGKTTLLRCLAGLQPFEGQVLLGEQKLRQLSRKEIAQHLAIVPQNFFPAFRIRVREFVLTGRFPYLNWLGQYTHSDQERVSRLVEQLGLAPLEQRFIQELSGGELQKVLLARALCQDTPVLLLDEPAQSLDPFQKNWLYQQLSELAKGGKTILCATHDLNHLHQDHLSVLAIKNGHLLFHCSGEELDNDRLSEVYAQD